MLAVMSAPQAGTRQALTYVGSDSSEIPEVEARGGIFRIKGEQKDPLLAMKEAGWNSMRLRVWNQPKDGYCDMAHTLAMAKRIKAAGLKLMIDFHYSDYWADPGKQFRPAAWEKMTPREVEVAVFEFTRDSVAALVNQGTPPEVVQVGNEVTNGMLWPEARLNINGDGWDQFIAYTKAGIKGAREGGGKTTPKIMVHIDQGGRNNVSRFWLDQYFAKGGEADIIGLSYYPFWHGTLKELKSNLNDLSNKYKKPILIAETAYPHQGWNDRTRQYDENAVPDKRFKANPEGQALYLKELTKIVKSTAGGRGAGILWWAPTWIGQTGRTGGWNRYLMFDPDTGEAFPSFYVFGRS